VLDDRGETDVERLGQPGCGGSLRAADALDQVASGRVGECVQDAVKVKHALEY
jgi:hypothetical protein